MAYGTIQPCNRQPMIIEIDQESGFCFGVTRAIRKAEEELQKGQVLYCLGDIVHNGKECDRLKKMGLITIDHEKYEQLKGAKVLLRAHGEPPATYIKATENQKESKRSTKTIKHKDRL